MNAVPMRSRFDRARWQALADGLVVCIAVSLPWSTSATGILIVVWIIAVLPTLDLDRLKGELVTAAGGLPAALLLVAALGVFWADVAWAERLGWLGKFARLLVIPLLLAQFRHSPRALWVLYGYLGSVTVLLVASLALALLPGLGWRGNEYGVPVKDYIIQSESFLICAFVLIAFAFTQARAGRWRWLVASLTAAVVFLADIAFVITSRTVLLVAPVLVVLLGWRLFGWRGLFGAGALAVIVGGAVAFGSPYLHERLNTSVQEFRAYHTSDASNSTGLHLEFLRKSLTIIASAPLVGHGTGSIHQQFSRLASGQGGAAANATFNPHNQMFAVAIQLGLVGAVVLLAMWAVHWRMFLGNGLIAWAGAVIVAENVISSLFNSHLFDFDQGWLYVFGVGVLGGTVLRERHGASAPKSLEAP